MFCEFSYRMLPCSAGSEIQSGGRLMRKYFKMSGCRLAALFLFLSAWLWTGRGLRACAEPWTYGMQLGDAARDVYDALSGIPDLSERFGVSGQNRLRVMISGEYMMSESDELASECYKGTDAFLRDHSELFWIEGFDLELGYRAFGSGREMTAVYVDLHPADYYSGIRTEIRNTQAAAARAVKYVKKYKGRYAKVKAAHDYILKLVDYAVKNTNDPRYHTITGGLLGKYGHKGVCETYAKLFDIVCKANGIPDIIVTGGLGSRSRNHMWNCVQMDDGRWYLVDITNDDQERAVYDYFLAGSDTDTFAGRVKSVYFASGYLRAGQYEPFRLPALSKTAYEGTAAKKLAVPENRITLKKGKKYRISLTRKPGNAADALTYASSDLKIASVDAQGKITARKKGKAVVTVRSASGKKARIRVTVK